MNRLLKLKVLYGGTLVFVKERFTMTAITFLSVFTHLTHRSGIKIGF